MSISIIIPNYNGESLLEKNLPKVCAAIEAYKSTETKELIIIDDASTDNSCTILEQFKQSKTKIEILILQNKKNLGFARSINKAVGYANGEVVILLNSDVSPTEQFLTPLLRHFTDKQVFAVGCLDESIESGRVVMRGRGIGSWKRGFLVHAKGEMDKNSTLWVNGGSGAFRKSIWTKLGGFCTLYRPFYWEDIDLGYAAIKAGYKNIFEKESIVIHEHEKGAIQSQYAKNYIKSIAYKNQFLFVWINVSDSELLLTHIIFLPYHGVKALISFDYLFFLGFFKAFVLVPYVVQYRFFRQKHTMVSDKNAVAGYLE